MLVKLFPVDCTSNFIEILKMFEKIFLGPMIDRPNIESELHKP